MGALPVRHVPVNVRSKVDVPSFRSRFLNIYHTRYQRPIKDYLVANIETMLPLLSTMPRVVNGVLSWPWTQKLTAQKLVMSTCLIFQFQHLPNERKLSIQFDFDKLKAMSDTQRSDYVLIVQDPFTSFYDATVVEDFAHLVTRLGKTPIVLPFKPNGKAQHVKGFLKQFAENAQSTSDFLQRVASLGIPMVGVDPALVLCYRDEYVEALGEQRGDFEVLTVHEWLEPNLSQFESPDVKRPKPNLGTFCHIAQKKPNYPMLKNSGARYLLILVQSWMRFLWAVVAWQGLLGMKPINYKCPKISMRLAGRCVYKTCPKNVA